MINVLKNDDGFVRAYIEWLILNEEGQYESGGKFVYVYDMWIHRDSRRKDDFRELVKIIDDHPYSQKSEYVYWEFLRNLNGDRLHGDISTAFMKKSMSKIYNRKKIASKIIKKGGNND